MVQLAHVSFVVFKYFCPIRVYTMDDNQLYNRLLPKCNDRNKKLKRPLSLKKLTNFTRKLANNGTF